MARSVAESIVEEAAALATTALTTDEKDLCQNVVVFGPAWLQQNRGWTSQAVMAFVQRPEIQKEINGLKTQYEDRTGIQERTQFFAQIRLNGMVPSAMNVLARALRGTFKDNSGADVPAPTKQQLEAAREVLDRANIQGVKFAGVDATPLIDARSVSVTLGVSNNSDIDAIGTEGREKVRNILASVMSRAQAKATVDDIMGEEARPAKPVKRARPNPSEDDDEPPVRRKPSVDEDDDE